MAQGENVPQLRFFGFTDAWEQREFEKFADFNPPSCVPDAFQYVDLESVVGTEMVACRPELRKTAPSRAQRLAQIGDLFYQMVRPYQKNNYLFEIQSEAYVFSTGYAQIRPKCDGYFLLGLVQTDSFVKDVMDRCTGTSYPAINSKDLAKINICVPKGQTPSKIKNITEQQKIGTFFRNLDRLITLHQRKQDVLTMAKKALLEKMFPQVDEKTPQVRFSGFTDAWEQRKLGDEATEIIAGGDADKSLLSEKGKYPVIANALTNEGIVGFYKNEYRVKAPAVTITGRGDIGHAKARLLNFTPVVRLLSLKSPHNVFFLENAINTIQIIIESTGVPQLTVPQLSQYNLSFPHQSLEEEKIGTFFRNLDDLITLHRRKVVKLKKLKKACLEKMFV